MATQRSCIAVFKFQKALIRSFNNLKDTGELELKICMLQIPGVLFDTNFNTRITLLVLKKPNML